MAVPPYYVSTTPKGLEDGDGEANAMSMADAMDAVSAGEKVWVKADGVYEVEDGANNCVIHATTVGGFATPIVIEGYKDNIEDGGIVQINADPAGDQFASCLLSTTGAKYTVFKNFEFYGASANGVNTNGGDSVFFKNCSSHDNGANGFVGDDIAKYENCIAYSNGTGDGFNGDGLQGFFSCISYSNGGDGFECNTGIALSCLGYDNAGIDFRGASMAAVTTGCANCTFDGEGADNCIEFASGASNTRHAFVYNCIIHDAVTPIAADVDSGEMQFSGRNLYNLADNANSNFLAIDAGTGVGDRGDVVDPATLFNNEAGDDYSLHATSGALAKAMDANWSKSFWDDYNEGGGNNPPAE
ncbi:hypothetical protein KAR91_50750 [Candidatus Pacearchaeota archaeon]|nr:hypothetical protein [Candidatus Pacearchaeota archaeon]